jgi:hypothetical protein
MHDLAKMVGLELPEYLGKATPTEEAGSVKKADAVEVVEKKS